MAQVWYDHLIKTHYRILKFINDNENTGIFNTHGAIAKDVGAKVSLRHAQRVIASLKADGLIAGQGNYRITNMGKRVLNLERTYQDKAAEAYHD